MKKKSTDNYQRSPHFVYFPRRGQREKERFDQEKFSLSLGSQHSCVHRLVHLKHLHGLERRHGMLGVLAEHCITLRKSAHFQNVYFGEVKTLNVHLQKPVQAKRLSAKRSGTLTRRSIPKARNTKGRKPAASNAPLSAAAGCLRAWRHRRNRRDLHERRVHIAKVT